MKFEDQVVSRDISKRVEALGLEKESQFAWGLKGSSWLLLYQVYNGWMSVTGNWYARDEFDEFHSAFTVAELAEILPREIPEDWIWRCSRTPRKGAYEVKYHRRHHGQTELLRIETQPKLADAMAAMLVFLIEAKLFNPRA